MLRRINRRRSASRGRRSGRRVQRAGQRGRVDRRAAAFRSPIRVVIAHVDHASGFDAKNHPHAHIDDGMRIAATGRRTRDACMRPFALRRRSQRSALVSRVSMMRSDSIDARIRESLRCGCRRAWFSRSRPAHATPCSAASITSCRSRIARVDDAHGFDRKKHPAGRGWINGKFRAQTHAVIATSTMTSTSIAMRACAADVDLAAVQGAIRSLETTRLEFNVCGIP